MEQAIRGTTPYDLSSRGARELQTLPPVREVSRPHLVRRIGEGLAGRLVLLTGPAGWGKSSVLAEWARASSVQIAWVNIGRYGESGSRLVKGIVGAMTVHSPDFGKDLFAMLRSARPVPTPQLFSVLAEALEDYGEDVVLVMDDFHAAQDQDAIDAVFDFVSGGPPNLRVLISGRVVPEWPLARMRVTGDVTEIGSRDLAFSVPEIRAFFDEASVTDDVARTLHERSGGWAAGLQLVKLWMRSNSYEIRDISAVNGSRRDIAAYMAEEVMEDLPPDVRRFLYATALVDRFSLGLAEAMLGNGQAIETLGLVERHELFLIPDDAAREWYRYHDLFRDFLRSRAAEELESEQGAIMARAASWLRQQGFVFEAVDCLLTTAQVEEAAAALDESAHDLVLHDGETARLIACVEKLPVDVTGRYRNLQRFYAWALVLVGRLDDAESIAEDIESRSTSSDGDADAQAEAASIRSRIAAYRGDHEATIAYGLAALECREGVEDWFRADALLSMGFAHRATGQLAEACEVFARASELGWRSRFANAALWGSRYQALTLISRGRLEDAWSEISQDLERARDAGMTHGASFAALLVSRGELRYERNDLAGAREDLSAALRLARVAGDAKILMNVHVALAMLEAAEGRVHEAREAVRTAIRVFDGAGEKALEARLALLYGDMARVRSWLDEYVGFVGDQPTFNYGEAEQLMLGRAFIATGRVDRARTFLAGLLSEAESSDRAGTAMIVRSLLAQVEEAEGFPERAYGHARSVIDLAMRERYVRSILDEGKPFLEMLRRAMRHDPSPARREYARKILSSSEESDNSEAPGDPNGAPNPLTARQREVLQLMADGRSNREIADALYLAEGTVKAHMHQIFNKLMVRNRAEAIRAAQRIGLAS